MNNAIDDRIKATCDISLKTWLNEKELMVYVSLGRDKIREARKSGRLGYIDLMGKIIYNRNVVDAWVKAEAKRANKLKR